MLGGVAGGEEAWCSLSSGMIRRLNKAKVCIQQACFYRKEVTNHQSILGSWDRLPGLGKRGLMVMVASSAIG